MNDFMNSKQRRKIRRKFVHIHEFKDKRIEWARRMEIQEWVDTELFGEAKIHWDSIRFSNEKDLVAYRLKF